MSGTKSSAFSTTAAVWVSLVRLLTLSSAFHSALVHTVGPFSAVAPILLLASFTPLIAATLIKPPDDGSTTASLLSKKPPSQASHSFQDAAPLLLPVVASDSLLLLSVIAAKQGQAVMAGSLGAAFGATLLATVLQRQYIDRLSPWRAAIGSTAKVHVTVITESGSVIDTTRGKQPLVVSIGQQGGSSVTESSVQLNAQSMVAQPSDGLLLSKEAAKGVHRFVRPRLLA